MHRVPRPSDFTSAPGATMPGLRREKVQELTHYVGYLNTIIREARAMAVPEDILIGLVRKVDIDL